LFKIPLFPADKELQHDNEPGQGRGSGKMKKKSGMSKREIIRALIMSPCYLTLTLRERARLIQRLFLQRQ
jgi:hypothetical protein